MASESSPEHLAPTGVRPWVQHFFFNIWDDGGLTPDDEGRDLPDLEAACKEAVSGIRSLVAEDARRGSVSLSGRVEVLDAEGRLLASVPFNEAVLIRGGGQSQDVKADDPG